MTRVADLAGGLLDYWVGRAEGIPAGQLHLSPVANSDVVLCVLIFMPLSRLLPPSDNELVSYCPSQSWGQGGKLIEKHNISVEYGCGGDQPWQSEIGFERNLTDGWVTFGSRPLIAAMRALVASVYGDTVEEVKS